MKMAVYKKEKGDKMCNGEHFKWILLSTEEKNLFLYNNYF
jgi:hypothetical protein